LKKKLVYVETSVVSYLTARPSHDAIKMAQQLATRDWWENYSSEFELYISPLVEQEASKGNQDAAARRLAAISEIPQIRITEPVIALAELLLRETAVPKTSFDDAVHIATAAIQGVDFLLSWNCRHIANPMTKPIIRRVLEEHGFKYPEICTPFELKGAGYDTED